MPKDSGIVVLPWTHGAIKTSAVRGVYPLEFIHSLLHLQTLIGHWRTDGTLKFQFLIMGINTSTD